MIKAFFDTNLILDIVDKRAWEPEVKKAMDGITSDEWGRMYVSYLSLANIAYIKRKESREIVNSTLRQILKEFNVLPMNDMQILRSIRNASAPDFEDSLQIACAEDKDCDLILTRNPDHFRPYTWIPVLTPAEFLAHCSE